MQQQFLTKLVENLYSLKYVVASYLWYFRRKSIAYHVSQTDSIL